MLKCSQCGRRLRRVHRTFTERLRYAAIYYCKVCDNEEYVSRLYQYHLGPYARCPQCGTYRLSKLKERDKIDKMRGGVFNWLERFMGGDLFHCRFCRVQFYDRRGRAPRTPSQAEAAQPQVTGEAQAAHQEAAGNG